MNCVHGVRMDKWCHYCATATEPAAPPSYTESERIVAEALVWAFEQRPGWPTNRTPQDLLEAIRTPST